MFSLFCQGQSFRNLAQNLRTTDVKYATSLTRVRPGNQLAKELRERLHVCVTMKRAIGRQSQTDENHGEWGLQPAWMR